MPLQELLGRFLILLGRLGIDAPVVGDHLVEALLLLAVDAHVDRQHAEVLIRESLILQCGVNPYAVLEEHRLAERELRSGIIHGLA